MRIPMEKCPPNFLADAEKYKDILYLACIEDWRCVQFILG
jgi:hypothetical protein